VFKPVRPDWSLFLQHYSALPTDLYYLAFPKDRMYPTKLLAISIYLFETLQIILATVDAFRNFGYKYVAYSPTSDDITPSYALRFCRWGDMEELNKVGLIWFSVVVQGAIGTCGICFGRVYLSSSRSLTIFARSRCYRSDILCLADLGVKREVLDSNHHRFGMFPPSKILPTYLQTDRVCTLVGPRPIYSWDLRCFPRAQVQFVDPRNHEIDQNHPCMLRTLPLPSFSLY